LKPAAAGSTSGNPTRAASSATSLEPIPPFTSARTPLFWQRPSRGWQPIQNAPIQAFNITNSDLIRWQNLWSKFANFFGMKLAPRRHINLGRSMADKGPIWEKIVEQNGLQKFSLRGDCGPGLPGQRFRIGLRHRLGYDLADTEEMFLRMFSDFRRDRIIPLYCGVTGVGAPDRPVSARSVCFLSQARSGRPCWRETL
jgi:hypothetical protein